MRNYIFSISIFYISGLAIASDENGESNYIKCTKYYKKDYRTAFSERMKAAKNNHRNAQYMVGVMYQNGLCTNRDYTGAALWYEKSSAQGNIYAKLNLANMYFEGLE
jgi:uncharacterized protein